MCREFPPLKDLFAESEVFREDDMVIILPLVACSLLIWPLIMVCLPTVQGYCVCETSGIASMSIACVVCVYRSSWSFASDCVALVSAPLRAAGPVRFFNAPEASR